MTAPTAKLSVPEVAPLVRKLYERDGAGCCLHIVLDDHNIGDGSVAFCILTAMDRGHHQCYALGLLLRSMSKTQRAKLALLRWREERWSLRGIAQE